MAGGFARHTLVNNINTAFHPDNIAATATQVAPLGPDADAFDIVHRLGLFSTDPGFDLDRYRNGLPIPALNRHILKLAFQTAVQGKIPLAFGIVSGDAEQIEVTTSATHIYVVLTRRD